MNYLNTYTLLMNGKLRCTHENIDTYKKTIFNGKNQKSREAQLIDPQPITEG